jgi:hypothetical protein
LLHLSKILIYGLGSLFKLLRGGRLDFLSHQRDVALHRVVARTVGEQGLKVPYLVAVLIEILHASESVQLAGLGVPQAEEVVVEDMVAGGLRFEGIEDLAGLLVETLIDYIVEKEGLRDVDGILDQDLRILLIQVSIKDSQICHILLLGVQGVSQAGQSLLEKVLGRQRGA